MNYPGLQAGGWDGKMYRALAQNLDISSSIHFPCYLFGAKAPDPIPGHHPRAKARGNS